MDSFDIAKKQWDSIYPRVEKFIKAVNDLSKELEQLGAPMILELGYLLTNKSTTKL